MHPHLLRLEIPKEKEVYKVTQFTMVEAFDSFIISKLANGLREKTIDTYKDQFHAISKHINMNKDISSITNVDIQNMIVSMRYSGLRSTSIQTYTRLLRTFFNWACDAGYSDIKIKLYHTEETMKEPYTDFELSLLLRRPKMECKFWEYRDWVIINFLLNSGCRAATLRSIKVKDISLDDGVVFFRHTKNGHPQVMPLCHDMKEIVKQYLKIRHGNPDDVLFCNDKYQPLTENALRKTIGKYNQSRQVAKTSIHLFRHTFAKKFLLDCGGDAFTLQHLLGHKTLDMTKHYCNLYNADIANRFESICPLSIINQSHLR